MKIIYLHQYFNTPSMPGGTRSYEMARRIVAAGHEVHMITSYRDVPAPVKAGKWFETTEDGIHVHWVVNPYSNHMSYADRIRSFIRFAYKSSTKASRLGGDVVFATSTPLTIAIPALYAKWRNKIPMVFEVRDLWPEGPIAIGALKNRFAVAMARWLERRAYFGAQHVVALSPDMREGVAATGYPSAQISMIPNSSDVELFRVPSMASEEFLAKHPYLAGGPLVIYAGTLGFLNGVGYLVQVAQEMQTIDPAVKFLVIGEGREENALAEQAQAAGILHENFWLIKSVPKADMPKVLSACTIACSLFIDHPYTRQNSPNKAFDAFAAGRPLAVNHGGWISETVEETGAGISLAPRDPRAAAEKMASLLHDERRLATARVASAKLADTQFNRNRLAAELISVLEQVAQPKS
jgi:glycosyltransferase involved in cell wall biosynthesis